MMRKVFYCLMAAVLFMGLTSVSDARMPGKGMKAGMGMHMGPEGGHGMMEHIRALGLDEKQTAEVKEIHFKCKKETIKKKADVEVAEIELKEILGKDPVDLQSAEAKVRQIESLKSDLKIMHIKCREEIKGKLTPEQRKKFSEMTAGMGCDMCMMCDKGMPGGHGMMGGKCSKCRMMTGMDDENAGPAPKGKPVPPAGGHKH